MARSPGPALPPQRAIKRTLVGEVRSPPAGGLWQEDKTTDVLGQKWRTGRGQRQRGGTSLCANAGEEESENFWMHVSPLPSERADLLDQPIFAGEPCPYWQAEEAQLPPCR